MTRPTFRSAILGALGAALLTTAAIVLASPTPHLGPVNRDNPDLVAQKLDTDDNRLDAIESGTSTSVQHDGSLFGAGSLASPLTLAAQHGASLTGLGSVASPLAINVLTDSSLIGNGTGGASVLQMNTQHDASLAGTGAAANPMFLNVQHDATLSGTGAVGTSLSALPVKFNPARELFVASSWPAGVDATVYFTSIQSAINQANTMSPTQTNPMDIEIAPGTYAENITASSFVNLSGMSVAFPAATLTGTVTWAPTGSGFEFLFLSHLAMSGAHTYTLTGKTGGQTTLGFFNDQMGSALTYTGRANSGTTRDFVQFMSCIPGVGTYSFTTGLIEWNGGRLKTPFTFNGNTSFAVVGGTTIPTASGTHTINGTSSGQFVGSNLLGIPVTVAAGAGPVVMTGCSGTGLITSSAGSLGIDARKSNFTNFAGPGPIDRDVVTGSAGPTVGGTPLVVTFAIPFLTTPNTPSLQLTGGPGNAGATVTSVSATGFTITDSVGGNTFAYTATHP